MEESLYYSTESSSSDFSSDDEDLLVLFGKSRNRNNEVKKNEKNVASIVPGNIVLKLLNREVNFCES